MTYLFFTDKAQATAILGNHISRLVKVAVFPAVVFVTWSSKDARNTWCSAARVTAAFRCGL